MDLSIAQLEALVAVADEGSFTEAARALHIAQPSLSRRVHALQEALGAELFVPVGRRMELTATGRGVLATARRILRERDELVTSVEAVRELVTGTLRVAGLPSLLSTRAPALLGPYHREHPGVAIDVVAVDDAAQLAEAIRSGRADLGFGIDDGADGDVQVTPLAVQRFVAVLPAAAEGGARAADPAQRGARPLVREELEGRSLVTLPHGTSIRAVTDAAYSTFGLLPPRTITTSVRDSLVPLALASGAVTIVPDDLAGDGRAARARIGSLPMGIQRTIGVLHRREGLRPPAVESFLTLLRQRTGRGLDI